MIKRKLVVGGYKRKSMKHEFIKKSKVKLKNKWWAEHSSEELCKNYSEDFDKWWNADEFDWNQSWVLAEYCAEYFDIWWDPDKFDWDASRALVYYCADKFDKWWNADKFDWHRGSSTLAEYCPDHFEKWWDGDKFNWEYSSRSLAIQCANHFDEWWDPDKFDWKNSSNYLARFHAERFVDWWDAVKFNWSKPWALPEYCSAYLDIWWDAEKFNWGYSSYLAEFCYYQFNKWWDPDKFRWEYSSYLANYCTDYFNVWWDPEKFEWNQSDYLLKYCSQKFSDDDLKKLLNHPHENAQLFAREALIARNVIQRLESIKVRPSFGRYRSFFDSKDDYVGDDMRACCCPCARNFDEGDYESDSENKKGGNMKKFKIEKSKKGLPVMWENGGGFSNTGHAQIITGKYGERMKPLYVRKSGSLACGDHALLVINPGCFVIQASHHREDFNISIYEVLEIDTRNNEVYCKEVNKFSRGEWDNDLVPYLNEAVDQAKRKATCYHCRSAYYVIK